MSNRDINAIKYSAKKEKDEVNLGMYKPSQIANFFILRSIADNTPLTNLKLQKLIYVAHGFHLALTNGKPLLSEAVECWPYGPVVNSTYHQFKNFGSKTISIGQKEHQEFTFDRTALDTLVLTWTECKDLDAIQLSNWTHIEGSPWKRSMNEGRTTIPDTYILEYFKRFLAPPDNGTVGSTATAPEDQQ